MVRQELQEEFEGEARVRPRGSEGKARVRAMDDEDEALMRGGWLG